MEPIKNPNELEFELNYAKGAKRWGYTNIGVCPHCGALNKENHVMDFKCKVCNRELTYWLDENVKANLK